MDFTKLVDIGMQLMLRPKETLAAQAKKKAELGDSLVLYTLASLLGVLGGLLALATLDPQTSQLLYQSQMGTLLSNPLLYALLGLVMGLIGSFVWAGLLHLAAKLLGGKGEFLPLYFLLALISVPIALLHLLNAIPYVGILAGLLVSLYGLYMTMLALCEARGLDTVRALGAVLVVLVLVGVAAFVLSFMAASLMVPPALASAY